MSVLEAFGERKLAVVAALRDLSRLAGRVGARTLAERVEREIASKLESDRFHLVVVGEFNHGKTTFVNALLGRPVLPTGVTPTTAVIHHVVHAPEPQAAVIRDSGARDSLAFEGLRSFAAGGAHG